jgi:hypothetical protein
MQDVRAAFPIRPLRVRVPGTGVLNNLILLFGAALLLFGAIMLVGWLGPELAQDWRIRDTARPAAHGHLVHSHCSEKLFITLCDLTLGADVPGGAAIERTVYYLFASTPFEELIVRVMADPAEPAQLTTDLGLDRVVNRTLMMAGAGVLVVLGVLGAVRVSVARGRRRAALQSMQGQVLTPLVLTLEKWTRRRTSSTWFVRADDGGRQVWSLPGKAKPLFVAPGRILGVVGPQRELAVPLDAELRWIDLNDTERQRIWSAVASATPQTGGTPVRLDNPPQAVI